MSKADFPSPLFPLPHQVGTELPLLCNMLCSPSTPPSNKQVLVLLGFFFPFKGMLLSDAGRWLCWDWLEILC